MTAKTAGPWAALPGRAGPPDMAWRPAVDRVHGTAALAVLAGTAILALASPRLGAALQGWSGPLLLVGGALIGVPHGSSDFVVAHRLMRPALGRWWLPAFLAVYLALVAATLAAWSLLPLATLLGFLVLSGLHFGWGDLRAAAPGAHPAIAFAARATTPILPLFLIHPAGVAPLVAALCGVPAATVAAVLEALRWPLLLPWGATLALATLPALLGAAPGRGAGRAAGETVAIALAAVALPPLLGFGLYFCLVHAPRHMADLAEDHHPRRAAAAAGLVAAVVLPSALVCLAVLWFAWDGLAGLLDTATVLTWSLRIVAALTLPHMMLEAGAALWGRAGGDDGPPSGRPVARPDPVEPGDGRIGQSEFGGGEVLAQMRAR